MSRQMNVGATLRNGLVVNIALLLRLFAACGPDKPQPAPLSPRVIESKSATAADQSHKTDSIQIDNEVAAPAANRSVLDAGAPRTPVGSAKVASSTAADQVRLALESELRARTIHGFGCKEADGPSGASRTGSKVEPVSEEAMQAQRALCDKYGGSGCYGGPNSDDPGDFPIDY